MAVTETLLRLPEVRAACALSRTEMYRRLAAGEFPRPIALGRRAVAWRSSEIQDWIASRTTKLAEPEASTPHAV